MMMQTGNAGEMRRGVCRWILCTTLALAAGLVTSGDARAQSGSRLLTEAEKDSFIQQIMKSAGIPGLQTVVVNNTRVIWNKSYGQAVLAQPGPPTPMRDDSILFTCSIAKILTAVAVMQQVEKGRL